MKDKIKNIIQQSSNEDEKVERLEELFSKEKNKKLKTNNEIMTT